MSETNVCHEKVRSEEKELFILKVKSYHATVHNCIDKVDGTKSLQTLITRYRREEVIAEDEKNVTKMWQIQLKFGKRPTYVQRDCGTESGRLADQSKVLPAPISISL